MILSALEAAGLSEDRRRLPRRHYHRAASLRLFADVPGTPPWRLFIRDINQRGMGFLTPHRLPLGYGGTLELPRPCGRRVPVNCTLLRCRPITPGWYEGALYFNRDQMEFRVDESSVPSYFAPAD
jgi:hypothetical protein